MDLHPQKHSDKTVLSQIHTHCTVYFEQSPDNFVSFTGQHKVRQAFCRSRWVAASSCWQREKAASLQHLCLDTAEHISFKQEISVRKSLTAFGKSWETHIILCLYIKHNIYVFIYYIEGFYCNSLPIIDVHFSLLSNHCLGLCFGNCIEQDKAEELTNGQAGWHGA